MLKYSIFLLLTTIILKADTILDIIKNSKYQYKSQNNIDITFNDIFSNKSQIYGLYNINSYSTINLNQKVFEGTLYEKDDFNEFAIKSEWSNIVDSSQSSAKELVVKWIDNNSGKSYDGVLSIVDAMRVKFIDKELIEITFNYKDRDWQINQDLTNEGFANIFEYKNSLTNSKSIYIIDNFVLEATDSKKDTNGKILEAMHDGYREIKTSSGYQTMPIIVRSQKSLGSWTIYKNILKMDLHNSKRYFKIENRKAYEKYEKYITVVLNLDSEEIERYLFSKYSSGTK